MSFVRFVTGQQPWRPLIPVRTRGEDLFTRSIAAIGFLIIKPQWACTGIVIAAVPVAIIRALFF